MMKRLTASVLTVCGLVPAVSAAPTVLPERFASCWIISVPLRKYWVSPIVEHEIRYGELGAETERVRKEFLGVVRAGSPALPADEAAFCTFTTTRVESEAEQKRMRRAFRFNSVDTIEVPWRPSAAPTMAASAAPPVPVAPAPPAAMRPDTSDIEVDYWSRIADSQVAEDFDDYLKAFPKGRHAPLAQLQAKRLRRGGKAGGAMAHSTVAVAGATPQSDPAFPIDEAVRATLADDASFRIPAGHGAPMERVGEHSNMVGGTKVYAMANKVRREAGDLCRLEQRIAGIQADSFVNTSRGLTWAGLLPLSLDAKSSSKYSSLDSTHRTTAISHQGGAMFPLAEGATHAFGVDVLNFDNANGAMTTKQALSCRVGATGPAASAIPGMAGEQTELQCSLAFPAHPTVPVQLQVYHWFSETGCFVQDPTRP